MRSEQYAFHEKELIIIDPELGIDLRAAHTLPHLPPDLSAPPCVVHKDPQGQITTAYCVQGGRRHGQCRTFADGQTVRSEMFYADGKLHGPSTAFGNQGEVLAKTWYFEGKKIGKARFYFPSGALHSLQRYKGGEWEGLQEYFYEDGKVKSVIPFVSGQLHGEVRLLWESGQLKRSVSYTQGLREGWDRLWNAQGVLIDEGAYIAGKPIGHHRHFFPNGSVEEECYFHTPLRCDRKRWDVAAKLVFSGVFANDLSYTETVDLGAEGIRTRKGVWRDERICFE